jgi:glycosyltransferase involved in cell wall biosynthesis
MREAARGLAARGWDVEVLTTCVRDHFTWANSYPEGVSEDQGLRVRRFPVVHDGRGVPSDVVSRIQLRLPVSPRDEVAWVSGPFRAPGLFHHLIGHAADFRAVVFSPYLFWSTFVGALAVPEQAIVMPCLHDEPAAYLSVFRQLLSRPAQVWFLSEPEHQLGHRLGAVAPVHAVVGAGVPVPDGYDPEGFKARHQLKAPFALYAGRREQMKGWDDLLMAYAEAVTRLGVDLDLVSVGVGDVKPPREIAGRVIDLGFLPQEEIGDAFAASAVYLQPSPHESFSRTVMEAWLAGTPVIASALSDVVRWHCERSGAGLVYADAFELAECLALVAEAPEAMRRLAAPGRDYVLTNYTWDAVLDRMEAALEGMPA